MAAVEVYFGSNGPMEIILTLDTAIQLQSPVLKAVLRL